MQVYRPRISRNKGTFGDEMQRSGRACRLRAKTVRRACPCWRCAAARLRSTMASHDQDSYDLHRGGPTSAAAASSGGEPAPLFLTVAGLSRPSPPPAATTPRATTGTGSADSARETSVVGAGRASTGAVRVTGPVACVAQLPSHVGVTLHRPAPRVLPASPVVQPTDPPAHPGALPTQGNAQRRQRVPRLRAPHDASAAMAGLPVSPLLQASFRNMQSSFLRAMASGSVAATADVAPQRDAKIHEGGNTVPLPSEAVPGGSPGDAALPSAMPSRALSFVAAPSVFTGVTTSAVVATSPAGGIPLGWANATESPTKFVGGDAPTSGAHASTSAAVAAGGGARARSGGLPGAELEHRAERAGECLGPAGGAE